MRAFIVSMSLFAVLAAYIALRSHVNKAEATDLAIADKNQLQEIEQSASADYRKPRKAREEEGMGSPRHCPKVCQKDWQSPQP